MKTLIKLLSIGVFAASVSVVAQEAETTQTTEQPQANQQSQNSKLSMDELLEKVRQGHRKDQAINEQRLQTFRQNLQDQQNLLSETKRARADAEALSARREQQFEDNEQKITLLQARLAERLGSLKELFGVMQLVSNDSQGQFDNSLIQIHYPDRSARLNEFSEKMGQTTELPTVEEIEALWYELQREMTDSGKLVLSKHSVLTNEGQEVEMDVLRLGSFNLVANKSYLQRIPETGRIVEFPRQPSSRYMSGVSKIMDSEGEIVAMTVDPVRGQLISLLGAAPNLTERVQQGGVIGYVIVSLGVVVVLMAFGRFLFLLMEDKKIQHQLKDLNTPGDNALGRLIQIYQENKDEDQDSLELKLGEGVLREVPRINRGLSFIKISAAIAPLLGLLGTVTGMIITFQAITLFGAGDPKLMAGGISQALVTTVLGLTVAIPSLLMHNLVSSKATKLSQILEQEAVALIANPTETQKVS